MKKRAALSNEEIAGILREMAAFCEMFRLDFKNRAYELAAADVAIYPENVREVYAQQGLHGLMTIPSVGKGIARHIEELLKTGHFPEYEDFKKKVPVNLSELLSVPGIGPRTVLDLWSRLKVKNLADLEKVCLEGKVRKLPRFGIQSETRILREIEKLKEKESQKSGDRTTSFSTS